MKMHWLTLALLVLTTSLTGNAAAVIYLDATAVANGPCYLDVADATYVLTEDINAAGTGFIFTAAGITLDLNQHQLTFGTAAAAYRYGVALPPAYKHRSKRWWSSDIKRWQTNHRATIKNGLIIQAQAVRDSSNTGFSGADSCGAIFAHDTKDLTINNVAIVISGDDSFAMLLKNITGLRVFANEITDETEIISNRHQGRAAIDIEFARDNTIEVFSNTIRNCRQWGIRITRTGSPAVWGRIFNNKIYPQAIVTNGYAIGVHGDRLDVYGNKIVASTGFGIHINDDSNSSRVHDNTIEVTTEPTWPEYPRNNSHGIALERCTNAEVYDNSVISNGVARIQDAVSNGCALKVGVNLNSHNHIYNNTFEARHLGGIYFDSGNPLYHSSTLYTDEFGLGDVVIENNTFITQDRFFTIYSWTGPNKTQVDASAAVIKGNRWIRKQTTVPTSQYAIFLGGASIDNLRFIDNDDDDFRNFKLGWFHLPNSWRVAYSITAKTKTSQDIPIPDATISVFDQQNNLVTEARTDQSGEATFILDAYLVFVEGEGENFVSEIVDLSSYRFVARYPGGEETQQTGSIIAESKQVLTLTK